MDNYRKFGLIGKNISYSFSKNYFEEKFKKLMLPNCSYTLFDLENIDKVEDIFKDPNMIGFNVTQPYKQTIIPYLDELSPEAESVQAVNTVLIKDGKKIGYNTDIYGFEKTLKLFSSQNPQHAIILGDGGAAQAVKYILKKNNINILSVSRKGETTFETLTKDCVTDHQLIIQCTPVGTFPKTNESVGFPFEGLTKDHIIIDLIYNPGETLFMKKAKNFGTKTLNGLYMLEMQAEKAWEIWNF